MSVINRGRDKWEVYVELGIDPVTGKRLRHTVRVNGKKREAQAIETKLLRERDTGLLVDPTKMTVGEYLEVWLRDYAKRHVSERTYERYEGIVRNHLTPALGHTQLDKLRPAQIHDYYAKAEQSGRKRGEGGLSPTTVLQHHRVLREALEHAVKLQILASNPCNRVIAPKKTSQEAKYLDEPGLVRLLTAARGTRYFLPILVLTGTGLRRGELLALTWGDVRLEDGPALTVTKSLSETSDGAMRVKVPKTANSRRTVALSLDLVPWLASWREEQLKGKSELEQSDPTRLVFPGLAGGYWSPNGFTKGVAKLMRRAKVSASVHSLRHTHATQLMLANTHPKVVSQRLGHSSVGITLNIYSHLQEGMDRQAADVSGAVLKTALNAPQEQVVSNSPSAKCRQKDETTASSA